MCSIYLHTSIFFYTAEQIRNKLNTKDFLSIIGWCQMLLSISKIIWMGNSLNVNFEILSKKDAYLERTVHG